MNKQLEFFLFLLLVLVIVIPINVMLRRARVNKVMPRPVYHLLGFVTATIVFGCIWAAVGYFWNMPGSIRIFAIMGALSAASFMLISVFIEWLVDPVEHDEMDDDEDDEDDEDDYFDD